MATTKKATVKKSSAKKPVAKKVSTKTPSKKSVLTRKASATQSAEFKSFRLNRDPQPFYEFRITRQTVYWVILISFIIFAQLWIINLQIEVAILLDSLQSQITQM